MLFFKLNKEETLREVRKTTGLCRRSWLRPAAAGRERLQHYKRYSNSQPLASAHARIRQEFPILLADPDPMDRLDESSGTLIARNLVAEQDLAAVASTCRFWRSVLSPDNAALWSALLHARFGPDADTAATPAEGHPPAALYRQLASRVQPVVQLEKIVWLNGVYLQRVREEDSTFGEAIRVREVCWLELVGRWRGVLPGRYRAVWRVRLEVGAAGWVGAVKWVPHAPLAVWHAA